MAILPNTATSFSPINSFFGWVSGLITSYAEAQSRTDMVQLLNDKSDEELAEMGVKREDIVWHVFRDRIYV